VSPFDGFEPPLAKSHPLGFFAGILPMLPVRLIVVDHFHDLIGRQKAYMNEQGVSLRRIESMLGNRFEPQLYGEYAGWIQLEPPRPLFRNCNRSVVIVLVAFSGHHRKEDNITGYLLGYFLSYRCLLRTRRAPGGCVRQELFYRHNPSRILLYDTITWKVR